MSNVEIVQQQGQLTCTAVTSFHYLQSRLFQGVCEKEAKVLAARRSLP